MDQTLNHCVEEASVVEISHSHCYLLLGSAGTSIKV